MRSGEISGETLDAYLRSRPRGPVLVDQRFLAQVVAPEVLFFDSQHPIRHDAVPVAFSSAPDRFELNHGVWLTRTLGMPPALKQTSYRSHPLEGDR